jgi:hypothetical protein
MPVGYVDTRAVSRLAADLAKASPAAWAAARVGLRAAGQIVADDAKLRTSYSSRIEWTIKVRTGRGNVKVIAGGDAAPNAAPIENKGKGFVRHPVFGNREVWTAKNSHPAFLQPALDSHREEVLDMIEASVNHAVDLAVGDDKYGEL